MTWICNYCYSEMNVTKQGRNRYRVECPDCGTFWIIDNNDEVLDAWSPDDESDVDDDENLDACDAALIWMSHGRDEDYMFGYTEEELESAL